MSDAAEKDVEIFASKLFEWLAEFGVVDASKRAHQVAGSFVRDGWTRTVPPAETRCNCMGINGQHQPYCARVTPPRDADA